MNFYDDRILPVLIDLSMHNKRLRPYRERIAGDAKGCVLEVGVGPGLNLPLYGRKVKRLFGLEPSPRLLARARQKARGLPLAVEFLEGSAEAIRLEDKSIDTVVMTWTLCTIPDAPLALNEIRRVLKPDGELLFVEHGRAPDEGVRWWQDRLTPLWKKIGGGCHLNRPIAKLIEGAGFAIDRLETGYIPGPKPMTFMYTGNAKPR
ncbi:MAG: class I SAM-dependent methyltransferase [Rhodospirillales bacterium]|nr:class I SAM-dependent methyltransferase [Rhodospirillales bacterium]